MNDRILRFGVTVVVAVVVLGCLALLIISSAQRVERRKKACAEMRLASRTSADTLTAIRYCAEVYSGDRAVR